MIISLNDIWYMCLLSPNSWTAAECVLRSHAGGHLITMCIPVPTLNTLHTASVLGRDNVYTVKYDPLSEGVYKRNC